jgi:hypothetical protein
MISTPAHFSVVSYYTSFAADFANAFLDDRSGGAMQTLIKVGDIVGHIAGNTKMAVAAIKMPGVRIVWQKPGSDHAKITHLSLIITPASA